MKKHSFAQKFRYRFDNLMAKGNASMVKMLVIVSLIAVAVIALVIHLITPAEERDLAASFWDALASAVNAWMPYSDEGGAAYILLTALAAVTGLLFTSILIGIIASAIEEKVTGLKDGNSVVLESGHIVVLGFVPGEYTLIRQLIATARGEKLCIVIAGDLPKSETEGYIRDNVETPKNVRIICRCAEAGDITALQVCSLPECKTVVINQPDDASTVKSMLAAHRILAENGKSDVSIIANISEEAFLLPRGIAESMDLINISVSDVIARVIAHSCTETGITKVYSDLFDIEGGCIRLMRIPGTAGKSFSQLLNTMKGAVPLGMVSHDRTEVNPDGDAVIGEEDTLICWTEDGKKITFADVPAESENVCFSEPDETDKNEHTVVIGNSPAFETLLQELPEQRNTVTAVNIPLEAREELNTLAEKRDDVDLAYFEEDISSETGLLKLLSDVQHVVILADNGEEDGDIASIMRYIRVNDIKKRLGLQFSVTLELVSEKNLQLIGADSETDFIVAPHISSMFLAQLADCPEIVSVFRELLSNSGSEIHLKPAGLLKTDGPASCASVRAALSDKKMILLGYIAGGNTVINPDPGEKVTFGPEDRLIVISEK